jgi:hypothetical protein
MRNTRNNGGTARRMYTSLRSIYSPGYIVLNLIFVFVYYLVFTFIIRAQDYGILLLNVPQYLVWILVISSSILFTIAVYSIRNTVRNQAKFSASTLGAVTTVAGGVVNGCGCSAPIIFSLSAIGLSSSQLIGLDDFLSQYSLALVGILVIINLVVILYYLNKLSNPSCKIAGRKRKR